MVVMANHMDEEQHEMFMERVADSYDETVNDIQNIIYEIRLLVSKCDPLKLLKYAYGQFFQSLLGITSEAQLKEENVIQGREVEYIQSILASTEVEKTNNQEDQSELFFSISEKIEKTVTQNNCSLKRDSFLRGLLSLLKKQCCYANLIKLNDELSTSFLVLMFRFF